METNTINTNGVTINNYGQTTINIYNGCQKDEGIELCKQVSYACGICRHCKTSKMMSRECTTCNGTINVDDAVKRLIGFLVCNNWEINPNAYILNKDGIKTNPVNFINEWEKEQA